MQLCYTKVNHFIESVLNPKSLQCMVLITHLIPVVAKNLLFSPIIQTLYFSTYAYIFNPVSRHWREKMDYDDMYRD